MGQCHALALAIHEATGWPVQAEVDLSDLSDREYGPGAEWDADLGDVVVTDVNRLAAEAAVDIWLLDRRAHHSVCVAPDGRVLDITGYRARDEWGYEVAYSSAWRMTVPIPVLRSVVSYRDDGPRQDLDLARNFARELCQPRPV